MMIVMIKFRYRADSPPLHMLPKMTVPELLKNSSQLQIPQYRLNSFGISKNNESKRNKQKCEKKRKRREHRWHRLQWPSHRWTALIKSNECHQQSTRTHFMIIIATTKCFETKNNLPFYLLATRWPT